MPIGIQLIMMLRNIAFVLERLKIVKCVTSDKVMFKIFLLEKVVNYTQQFVKGSVLLRRIEKIRKIEN